MKGVSTWSTRHGGDADWPALAVLLHIHGQRGQVRIGGCELLAGCQNKDKLRSHGDGRDCPVHDGDFG